MDSTDHLIVAVVSDLHCTYGTNSVSYLVSDRPKQPINQHPVESLKKISKDRLKADILLCPGDITDKVNKQGLMSGWGFLMEIKSALKAESLVVTLGNHDVDSRNQHKSGPFQFIKEQINFEPTEDDQIANDSFWRKNYFIQEKEKYILLVINSSFNHANEELAKTSQISPATIEQIEKELIELKSKDKIRIAMCHHHPMHHSNSKLEYKDSDFIDQSDKLLNMLEQQGFNLVVHGHKHDPRIVKHNSLPVFSSGSFSSMANLMDIGADNTFHLISFSASKKGTISSWVFMPLSGWSQLHDCYFPCFTGFGYSGDLTNLAQQCHSWFISKGKEVMRYSDLVDQFPDLIHLIPSEQTRFGELMGDKFGLGFSPRLPNKPEMLFKI